MADTQTPNLLLTNQTEGGNNNTWGTIADANFEEIDDKFGDVTSISTTGGTTTLTSSQEIVNALIISGTLVSNVTIVFSGRGGSWVVKNSTTGSFSVTCKVSGQTGVTIEQGGASLVFCTGTDIAYANPASSAAAEVTVASDTTADILGAASEFIAISGTTTITSFGTGTNRKRYVRATGAFKITHNATTLICPGAADITTIAGDTFIVVANASSQARIYGYQRASFYPPTTLLGEVRDFAGTDAPTLWLMCYGQNVSRTTYAALFAVIGTTYGVGDSVTTFGLPDLRGRVVAGQDDMGGSSANRLTNQSGGLDGDTLGAAGGSETHTLTSAESAAHTHTGTVDSGGAHTHDVKYNASTVSAFGGGNVVTTGLASGGSSTGTAAAQSDGAHTHTFTTGSSGSGGAHNNVQPTIVLNKIIFAGV